MKTLLRHTLLIIAAILVAAGAVSCSTKKNTAASRQWQAFNTRYNVYYNGNEHYKEQLQTMERGYEDDYTRMLLTHPADARADNKYPQPTGDFKRTIEKMQKAIQLHSIKKKPPKKSGSKKEKEFRAREEFNPFLHNAWMMLGKGQYYNGDFLGAASTFFYISKHFKWLPKTVLEAQIWQARSYLAMDWNYEAENVLHLVKPDKITDRKTLDLYNLVQGSYLVRSKNYKEAVKYLSAAAKNAKGSQKNRLWFLLGQVYEQLDQKKNAYEAFKKAGSGASTAYRTKFNARIKRSEVFTGSNIKSEVKSLKGMTRYERNHEFLDQIYYAIGNLYLSRKDTANAKENYRLAVEKSTRNGIDKALANLALGNIYFAERDYVKAQPCYSEAIPQLNDGYPGYDNLKRRSDVLDELAVYAGNVQLQDSLLTLSKMTPEEQLKVCQRLADEYTKKEKEAQKEAALQEALDKRDTGNSPMDNQSAAPGFQMNSDKSWYFYNSMTKNAGKTEFQRRWGARKLEDDWRRRNKTSYSADEPVAPDYDEAASDSIPGSDAAPGKEKNDSIQKDADPHYADYYLKSIPKSEDDLKTCNDVIQEGLYNMGLILKDKLEDYQAARLEFSELDSRYPDNVYRLDAYYNMYLMDVRQNRPADAERWRALIIAEFPDSPYGQAMLDPDYFTKLREMHAIQENLYQEAYDAYLADSNNKVHEMTGRMEADYPLSPILPKFVFIDALSYLTQGDNAKFQERLEYLLQKWPDTDMTNMAGSIVKGLKAGRVPHQGASNNRGLIWDMRLTNDSTATALDGPAAFKTDPNAPQLLVLVFPRDSVSANQLLYDVARFNFSTFVVKDFDLEPMSFGNVGLLIIRGFANLAELEHYRSVMARSDFQLPQGVNPVMISKENFDLLLKEGRSFEEYFRFRDEEAVERREDEVLGAGEGEAAVEEAVAGDIPGADVEAEEAVEHKEEASEEAPAEEAPAEETPAEEAPAEEVSEPQTEE